MWHWIWRKMNHKYLQNKSFWDHKRICWDITVWTKMARQPIIATPRSLSPARLKYKCVGFGDIWHDRQQACVYFSFEAVEVGWRRWHKKWQAGMLLPQKGDCSSCECSYCTPIMTADLKVSGDDLTRWVVLLHKSARTVWTAYIYCRWLRSNVSYWKFSHTPMVMCCECLHLALAYVLANPDTQIQMAF